MPIINHGAINHGARAARHAHSSSIAMHARLGANHDHDHGPPPPPPPPPLPLWRGPIAGPSAGWGWRALTCRPSCTRQRRPPAAGGTGRCVAPRRRRRQALTTPCVPKAPPNISGPLRLTCGQQSTAVKLTAFHRVLHAHGCLATLPGCTLCDVIVGCKRDREA